MTERLPRVLDDLECGSIGDAYAVARDEVVIGVQSTADHGLEGSLETWVCGRVVNAEGSVRIRVLNEHGNMRYLRPVISMSGEKWTHVAEFGPEYGDETSFSFTLPSAATEYGVAFATWWPYTYSRYQALVSELSELPFVHSEEIGRSVEGRPIMAMVIGEGDRRSSLAVSSGMHGGETAALHAMEGALRFICSDAGRELRRSTRLVAIPMINVDAQARGIDRRTASGVNLFLDDGAEREPELLATLDCLTAMRPSAYMDLHTWHWGGDGCFTPGWLASGEAGYSTIMRLRHALEQVFAMSPQIFVEDAPSNWLVKAGGALQAPVIAVEMSLGRGSDGRWKTLGRARRDGERIVRAALEYVSA